MALADFKSVMPRDERGRWVRLPRTPATLIDTETPVVETGVFFCLSNFTGFGHETFTELVT